MSQKLPSAVIIAGGGAERMGGVEKPLKPLHGLPLVQRIMDRLRPQVASLSLNVKQSTVSLYAHYEGGGVPLLLDPFGGEAGPLGGVVAGLDWISGSGGKWLVTAPADTPFLPLDFVARLIAASRPGVPCVAVAGGRMQGLCALWPVQCLARLAEGVGSGRYRSLWWTLDDLGAVRCSFDDETAFLNVNTEDDMKEAEAMARRMEDLR